MSANPVIERPRLARSEGSPQERTGDLYERYYDRVFGYCLYKLGDRQEAEDATQTTFLWVMRGLEHGIEPRLEANWLFTIAQNACRARIKTRGRKREQETLSDPQILEQVAPGRSGVQDELLGLKEALGDMPELQRQAIILREWRGFSYKEIAAELDLTDAAVETLIFRARRSLAGRLEHPNARPAKRATLAINSVGSSRASSRSSPSAAPRTSRRWLPPPLPSRSAWVSQATPRPARPTRLFAQGDTAGGGLREPRQAGARSEGTGERATGQKERSGIGAT